MGSVCTDGPSDVQYGHVSHPAGAPRSCLRPGTAEAICSLLKAFSVCVCTCVCEVFAVKIYFIAVIKMLECNDGELMKCLGLKFVPKRRPLRRFTEGGTGSVRSISG